MLRSLRYARNNLLQSFYEFDSLLAYIALAVWLAQWINSLAYQTNGFMDLVQNRIGAWNWSGWHPIATGAWYMTTTSVMYWLSVIFGLTMIVLLLRRIFMRPKDESLNKLTTEITKMSGDIRNVESAVQNMDRSLKEFKNELIVETKLVRTSIDKLTKIMELQYNSKQKQEGVEDGNTEKGEIR